MVEGRDLRDHAEGAAVYEVVQFSGGGEEGSLFDAEEGRVVFEPTDEGGDLGFHCVVERRRGRGSVMCVIIL